MRGNAAGQLQGPGKSPSIYMHTSLPNVAEMEKEAETAWPSELSLLAAHSSASLSELGQLTRSDGAGGNAAAGTGAAGFEATNTEDWQLIFIVALHVSALSRRMKLRQRKKSVLSPQPLIVHNWLCQ